VSERELVDRRRRRRDDVDRELLPLRRGDDERVLGGARGQ